MNREVKDTLINSLFLVVIFLLPSLFSGMDVFTQYCITLIVDLLIAFYLFNQLSRAGAFRKEAQEPNWKYLAILSPVVITLVPLFISLFTGYIFVAINLLPDFSLYASLELLNVVLSVLIDEMLFRIIFFKSIRQQNRGLKIIISAGIFALFEILIFFQSLSIIATLLDMIDVFILGIILGAIVEYGHSIYPSMIFHFLFKLSYSKGYLSLFTNAAFLNPMMYFILPAVAIIYLLVIYFVYFRKKEVSYYVQ